jgi:threonine dehydrogenase-like Zn-dependent dehydrogenase
MLRSVWTEKGIVLKDVEPEPLKDGWVRLKVGACGICGSDLHGYKDGNIRVGGMPGHEMAGTIMESTVEGLADELYAVEPWLWCGECEFWRSNGCARRSATRERLRCARSTLE